MKGLIFNVKRYAVHDGPGIRVTFFLKGCPLKCWWCHNPEGISPDVETVTQTGKVGEREFRQIEQAGKYYSVDEVIEILERESIFLNLSGGGVTFSGGEPLLQTEFLFQTLKACKGKGYHTAVDTTGYTPADSLKRIIPLTDLFLFDIKHMDDSRHIEFTGVSNKMIFSNFRILLERGKDIFVRIPVIPGFNDDDENLSAIKSFLKDAKCENLKKISLLPYHKIGKAKYTKFNVPYRMDGIEPPSSDRMQKLKEYFQETGIETNIGG